MSGRELEREQEAALVRQAQGGDQQAFGELALAHQQFIYNLALRSLGDPQEAQDIAQEALVRAWLGLPKFRGQSQFRTWLYRIVTNLCYNRLPRLRSELNALGDEDITELPAAALPESQPDPLTGLENAEQRAFLHQQIAALPESQRLLVSLRFQQDLSYAEIAEITGAPLGTVKTGLFRARERLRQALEEYEMSVVMMSAQEEPAWTS